MTPGNLSLSDSDDDREMKQVLSQVTGVSAPQDVDLKKVWNSVGDRLAILDKLRCPSACALPQQRIGDKEAQVDKSDVVDSWSADNNCGGVDCLPPVLAAARLEIITCEDDVDRNQDIRAMIMCLMDQHTLKRRRGQRLTIVIHDPAADQRDHQSDGTSHHDMPRKESRILAPDSPPPFASSECAELSEGSGLSSSIDRNPLPRVPSSSSSSSSGRRGQRQRSSNPFFLAPLPYDVGRTELYQHDGDGVPHTPPASVTSEASSFGTQVFP